MRRFGVLMGLLMLSACGIPLTPERAAEVCEERARAAAGPTGGIGVGVNSETGGFVQLELGITSDYIQGRDPYLLYDQCVRQRSGQGPIRPLEL